MPDLIDHILRVNFSIGLLCRETFEREIYLFNKKAGRWKFVALSRSSDVNTYMPKKTLDNVWKFNLFLC